LSLVNGLRSRLVALLGTRYGVVALSLLLATLIWGGLDAVSAPWLRAMEDRAGDWLWSVSAKQTDERRVIVVDIDDRSLSEIGPWPWPRATQAKLMDVLAEAGVRQQIFDVVFSEPRPDDSVLLQSVQKHHPVLAQVFALEQGGTPSNGQPAGALDWATCPAPFSQAQGYIANQSLFAVSASAPLGFTGHITPRVATDGVVRHQPAIICWGDKSYPALSLAAMMQAAGENSLSLQRGSWFESPWQLSGGSQTVGKIPLDERGDMRVSWRLHPNSFISLSAADLLAGRTRNSLPADVLSGAWVLVGSSAFGIKDTIATPFGGANAGLLAHAQLLAALIDGRTPYTPRVAAIGQVFVVLLGIAFLFALSKERPADNANAPRTERRFPIHLLPVAALGWCLVLWLAHAALLIYSAVWIGWVAPVLFVLLAGMFMSILTHAKSRIDRDRLYTHLSSYLPAPVAASLALQPPSGAIKASTLQVSVMFADIRNFSAYCEARPPEEAAAVLHAFFSAATRVVEAQGGVIEAFQGDAVIAVWNADLNEHTPAESQHGGSGIPKATHAQQALQAAINLQIAVQDVLPDPAPAGLEPLSLGIGVETGPAMAGSFGLASRRTHMVMGRTVTIASRLVEMTADLAHPILVGEGLAGQIGGAGLESMGTFLLDGMRVPHHVYAYPLVRAPHIY
jgi:adenylate cyclase